MCTFGRDAEPGWEPVFLRRGRARPAGGAAGNPRHPQSMRVRILCGAYDSTSPFIEGGCSADWIEELEGPDYPLSCPACGRRCSEEIVGCAREMLSSRAVFVIGCTHRAFTFSRRAREPYFSTDAGPSR